MKKWVVILVDRGLLENNQDTYELRLTDYEREVLIEEGEIVSEENPTEIYVELASLSQIIDYREVWAYSAQEAAKKVLLKYKSCLFLYFDLDENFQHQYGNVKTWFDSYFIYAPDQKYLEVDELDSCDILIRKDVFCNFSD